ncbi:hypothetical protein [Oryza sativa Japonica Group]|uniref:Uncharacterized protein P0511C01.8 n=1 Tax=Oryza sativa subsp. japonica TaxID=39947 RepID=Q5NB17_ORYSJ|nr:hypothetical protein [Oryza sativa Japonica Group]
MSTADNANGVDDARKIAEAERSIPYLASDDDANGERREDDGKQDVAEVGPDFVIVVMVMVVVMMDQTYQRVPTPQSKSNRQSKLDTSNTPSTPLLLPPTPLSKKPTSRGASTMAASCKGQKWG